MCEVWTNLPSVGLGGRARGAAERASVGGPGSGAGEGGGRGGGGAAASTGRDENVVRFCFCGRWWEGRREGVCDAFREVYSSLRVVRRSRLNPGSAAVKIIYLLKGLVWAKPLRLLPL